MAAAKLAEGEISAHLEHVPQWTRSGDTISRQYLFTDFSRALDFVNTIGKAAEDVQHHPDIDIRYNRVRLGLTTHDSHGLTLLDMQMAACADSAAETLGGE